MTFDYNPKTIYYERKQLWKWRLINNYLARHQQRPWEWKE